MKQFGIYSVFFSIFVTLVVSTFACIPVSWAPSPSPPPLGRALLKAQEIDTDRETLIQNAISWMAFRYGGKLTTSSDLNPLFEEVRDKYLESDFYKTFVIAFQNGVLPKLTLNEGDTCDSQYIWEYRDPFNYSVTHHYHKKFVFDNYNGKLNFTAYCDYRQGLVCNPDTSKCECPLGSKIEALDQQSTKMCLMQENEICTLIDLSHSSNRNVLIEQLPFLIFDLEKPLSCSSGTQCRFKDTLFPRCYPNAGTFQVYQGDESFDKIYGRECVLNLIAQPGMCEEKTGQQKDRGPNGYVCYNYWGRDGYFNKTGFCANELGPFGEILDDPYPDYKSNHPFLAYFVNPKTTPLRDNALEHHHETLIEVYHDYYRTRLLQSIEGEKCSVSRTEKMLEIYRFYASLETTKPDELALEEKLNEAVEATDLDDPEKMCNIIWHFEYENGLVNKNPMTCESSTGGDDGKCTVSPTNDEGQDVNNLINDNIDRLKDIEKQLMREEEDYDQSILDSHPEVVRPKPSTDSSVVGPGPGPGLGNVVFSAESCANHGIHANAFFVVVIQLISFAVTK